MKFLGRGVLVTTTALLWTALGFAQSNEVQYDPYGNRVSQTADRDPSGSNVFQTVDPEFMKQAAQDSMAKIHLAYLALQNAQNEQVKAYARQILSAYSKAQSGLFDMANQQFVVLPNTLDANTVTTFDALSQLRGAAFDKAYMKAMLNEDEMATSRYKQQAKKGDDWASHTLPTLESNFKEAQRVALEVGVGSKATSQQQRAPTPSAGAPASTVSQKP